MERIRQVALCKQRKEKEATFKLMRYPNEPVGTSKESLEHVGVLFDIKFKKRINQIEMIHCILRALMLWDSLLLPG